MTAASPTDHVPPVAGPVRRRNATARLLEAVPLALAIVAEAAWVAALAAFVQEVALQPTWLGIPAMAGFVAVGVAAVRIIAPRAEGPWPFIAVALIVGGGLAGWLASPDVRTALGSGNPATALAVDPGGWLAGLAVLRGLAYASLSVATLRHLLMFGVPGLAALAIVGGVVADPWRTWFLADLFVASVVFVSSATLALALTRLSAIGWDSGFDWRRNRAWSLLLMALVVAATAMAIPLALVAGPAVQLAVGIALVPIVVAGVVFGFNRRSARNMMFLFLGGAGVIVLLNVLGGSPTAPPEPAPAAPLPSGEGEVNPVVAFGAGGILVLVALLVILLLARLWLQQSSSPSDDVVEERTIDRGDDATQARPRRTRRPSRTAPTTAAAAYVALIEDLERRPAVRRDPAETPTEHAARLRRAGRGGLDLDLLAADYGLTRFGAVALTEREERRAIGRWRTLRRRLARDRAEPAANP